MKNIFMVTKIFGIQQLFAFVIFIAFSFLIVMPAEGASRRREDQKVVEDLDKVHQELLLYQNQLEDIRIKRWQDKRNAVAAQEAFSDAWNEVKADIDRLGQAKDQKEETLLRLLNQESEKQHEVDEQEARLKQFGLQVRDKLNELGLEWERGFPYRSMEKTGALSEAKKALEKEDAAGSAALDRLFTLSYGDFLDGESRSITRDKLAVKGVAAAMAKASTKDGAKVTSTGPLDMAAQAKIVAGYFVRLGQAYETFVSTEGEDVAILGKTGRLDGQAWDWIEDVPDQVRKELRSSVMALVSEQGPELVALPMDVLLTKATGEGFTTKAKGTFWKTMEHEFDGGGWVMWPIMLLAGSGILIILEKIFVFMRRDQDAQKLADRVLLLTQNGKRNEAILLCKKQKGSVSRVLLAILEHADGPREEAESKAFEVMLHESPSLEKRITTMNILAAASPLVGLLGTVTGMVRLFDVITVHGTGNPKLMAGGISEALIATKWGLGVAIPLLLSYNLLDNWSTRIIGNMEKYSARLVNTLYKTRKRVAEHV